MPKNNQWTTVTSKKSKKSKESSNIEPAFPSTKPKQNAATVVEYDWDSHQSLNSFKCHLWYCDKTFSNNGDLKRHMKHFEHGIDTDKSDTMSSYSSKMSTIE